MKYNHKKIESKWQRYWEKHPELTAADDKNSKPKQYILDMFPYPSGDGLHIGHIENYTASDIMSRYFRMRGKNVLHPQGWDAFGLPAENYAIKTRIHPAETTKKAIINFKKQMNIMGFSYDWSREVNSSDPEYYKWTQWFFLLLYKNGLAYKKKGKVNWCDSCQTVLANEQAEGGVCERCGQEVVQRDLEQWYFKITNFIENLPSEVLTKEGKAIKTSGLLDGLDKIDWPESTKAGQRNWIGRSEGAQFAMSIEGSDEKIEVYTTRLDTVFGMTFALIAPEHKKIQDLKPLISNWAEVEKYIAETKKKTDLQRISDVKDKTGVEIKGVKIINPFTKKAISLFASDFVLAHYGTGAVMAVPGHDTRDYDFARKYNLPIKQVVAPYFTANPKSNDIVRADKKTVRRKTVYALIFNKKNNKFLCLDWEKYGWHSGIIGGVDEGETYEEAALREIQEETGYKNLKFIKYLSGLQHNHFFAAHKDENRYAFGQGVLFELVNDEKEEIAEEHVKNHKSIWIDSDKMKDWLNLSAFKYMWESYESGSECYVEDGIILNSGEYDDLTSAEARKKLIQWLEKEKIGKKTINYRLRDWLVSRQRYWGAPIPIIYCDKCGEVPVPEKDLPVQLPTDVDFMPTGESPLVKSKKFQNVKCPKCGAPARRESDTMDTFVCSSWYYFRYTDPKNDKEFASKKMIEKWLAPAHRNSKSEGGVDLYIGGAEHVVLHLLYARFFTKVLHKLGYIDFDEPFLKLRHQGIILAPDGRKMSKSLGNVVNPEDVVKEYGADALRMFEMFMGPLEEMKPWNTKGIIGISRFLDRIWKLKSQFPISNFQTNPNSQNSKLKIKNDVILSGLSLEALAKGEAKNLNHLVHKTIKKVGEDIENLKFNTAISTLMILVNESNGGVVMSRDQYETFLILLAPFAPHIAEELWANLGHEKSIFTEKWPTYDKNLIKDETIQMPVQINGKVRAILTVPADISEDEAVKLSMSDVDIKKWLDDKEPKKVIFVKGRLVNIVV